MGFWIFMLIMDLLIPVLMIGIGKLWKKNPPQTINWAYGYRTKRAMRSKETWEFAHKYVADLWYRWGWIAFGVTIVLFIILYGESTETIGLMAGYYALIECIPLVAVMLPTERALKRKFDHHGQRIGWDDEQKAYVNVDHNITGNMTDEIIIPAGCEIREMILDDWNDIREIYQQGIEEGTSTFSTHVPTYEIWDEAHLKDCRYVIVKDDKVLGWCAISSMSSKKAYRGTVEVSVYVDKEHRKHGMGQALLRHMCIESKKAGYWSLYSCICAKNEGSIALHKKCGFRMIGRREAVAQDRFGVWQDTVLMERRNSIR